LFYQVKAEVDHCQSLVNPFCETGIQKNEFIVSDPFIKLAPDPVQAEDFEVQYSKTLK